MMEEMKMLIVKITIIMWVINIIFRFLVKCTIDKEDILSVAFTGKVTKMTPIRWIYVLTLFLAIIGNVASVVWLLFFR